LFFVSSQFDFVDGGIVAGEPISMRAPAAAMERASGKGSSSLTGFSEAEAKPYRGIDRAAVEEAVRQSAIDL
jgi:hypothetical protein